MYLQMLLHEEIERLENRLLILGAAEELCKQEVPITKKGWQSLDVIWAEQIENWHLIESYRTVAEHLEKRNLDLIGQIINRWVNTLTEMISNVNAFENLRKLTPDDRDRYKDTLEMIRSTEVFLAHQRQYLDNIIGRLDDQKT